MCLSKDFFDAFRNRAEEYGFLAFPVSPSTKILLQPRRVCLCSYTTQSNSARDAWWGMLRFNRTLKTIPCTVNAVALNLLEEPFSILEGSFPDSVTTVRVYSEKRFTKMAVRQSFTRDYAKAVSKMITERATQHAEAGEGSYCGAMYFPRNALDITVTLGCGAYSIEFPRTLRRLEICHTRTAVVSKHMTKVEMLVNILNRAGAQCPQLSVIVISGFVPVFDNVEFPGRFDYLVLPLAKTDSSKPSGFVSRASAVLTPDLPEDTYDILFNATCTEDLVLDHVRNGWRCWKTKTSNEKREVCVRYKDLQVRPQHVALVGGAFKYSISD